MIHIYLRKVGSCISAKNSVFFSYETFNRSHLRWLVVNFVNRILYFIRISPVLPKYTKSRCRVVTSLQQRTELLKIKTLNFVHTQNYKQNRKYTTNKNKKKYRCYFRVLCNNIMRKTLTDTQPWTATINVIINSTWNTFGRFARSYLKSKKMYNTKRKINAYDQNSHRVLHLILISRLKTIKIFYLRPKRAVSIFRHGREEKPSPCTMVVLRRIP